ncbi:MAG: DUF4058 family protein [Cyanobacteria bacterium J06634_6]
MDTSTDGDSSSAIPVPIEMKERYLEVREVGSNRVVAAIEMLSPANKHKGKGRDIYEAKDRELNNLVICMFLAALIP